MNKKTIVYRGSLKSCNYKCTYCPFSKHPTRKGELEKDQQALERFTESIRQRAQKESIGAVFFTPYGEASIHSYYWKAMAELSQIDAIDRIGLQTNLSFDGKKMSAVFEQAGGRKEKLHLWATFHPQMTETEDFVRRCIWLKEQGISICAGMVGVPEEIDRVETFRERLPKDLYLWINKMDGKKRNYTEEEIKRFLSVDPFFDRELMWHTADPALCEGRYFVEADGKMHSCNIARTKVENWYEENRSEAAICGRKNCSCYLAYGGRADHSALFGEYPLFRQPIIPKAIWVDIEGTIWNKQEKGISEQMRAKLHAAARSCPIFFVTSMPREKAFSILKKDMDLFQGGACASGGYLFWKEIGTEQYMEKVVALDLAEEAIRSLAEQYQARKLSYRWKQELYKITLQRQRGKEWDQQEILEISEELPDTVRIFAEANSLQIVSAQADKGRAVQAICNAMHIRSEETVAFGNDVEDLAMRDVCGIYIERKDGPVSDDFL